MSASFLGSWPAAISEAASRIGTPSIHSVLSTRAEVRAQLRREDVDPVRRRELLSEALGHIDRQLELVRHRAAELGKLEEELSETRKRARRKIRGLDAASEGTFPPEAEVMPR